MKYILIFLLLTATTLLFGQTPTDSIQAIIKREVANKRSKSIIVGIVDASGRKIFAAGKLSDSDLRLPDGNTIYEIGSITKVFTSLLLAEMSLKKQLNLSDHTSKFLPKTVKTPSRNGKEISLLNLSTHRSGMPRFPYNVDPKNLDKPYVDYTVKQLYEYYSNFKPTFDIDSRWQYSNVAYGVLGSILSIVANKDFEALVKEEISEPLNMHNTVISLTAKQKSNLAVGHAETGAVVGLTDLGAIDAGGALRANINDLLTFAEANLGFVKTDLLPAMELTHIVQAKKDGNDTFTTMGWTQINSDGKYLLFKDGGMPGYRTFLGIDKTNKIGVVVLANANNSVTDIGRYLLDPKRKIEPYRYPWKLVDTLRTTYKLNGANAAIELYRELKTSKNASITFDENQLNYLGNELRRAKKIKDALKIFELNVQEYPKSVLAYESLAETYRRNKQKESAIKCFEKARELDPENQHWAFILESFKSAERKKK